jgi:hypothetical protein
MAQFDSKTFNPEVFGKYVERIPNLTRNELLKSRAMVQRDELKALFAPQTGAFKGTLPYFGKIGKSTKNYDGQTNITPNGSETYTQTYIVVGRADAWTEKDFSSDITGGVDFMDNVAQQLGIYWDEVDTNTLTNILKGVFAMSAHPTFASKHTYDISAGVGDAAKFGVTTLNTGIQKALGDNKSKFALAIMHSLVSTNLENLNLINYLKYTDANGVQRDLSIGTLNGRVVLIDDGVPVLEVVGTAGVYTLKIDTNAASTDKIKIFGDEWVAGTDFTVGANAGATATNLKTALAAKTTAPYTAYTYTVESDTITMTMKTNIAVPAKPAVSKVSGTIALTYAEATEPVSAYNYTTYVFGEGAIEYCNVGAKVPYEMARDPATNGGETTLYGRQRKVFAPKGISFVGNPSTQSPTDEELATGSNWDVVNNGKEGGSKKYIDDKAIAICRIISRG